MGTDEPEPIKSGLENLHASFNEGKVQHVLYDSPGTAHEWQTWRRDLKDFAPRLFQAAGQQPFAGAWKIVLIDDQFAVSVKLTEDPPRAN